MNSYNLTLILNPDLEEKNRQAVLDSVKKNLAGGKVEKEDLWGLKEMAYPIKKKAKGYYAHLEFQMAAETARGIDKILKVEEDILRYLLVRTEKLRTKAEDKKAKEK